MGIQRQQQEALGGVQDKIQDHLRTQHQLSSSSSSSRSIWTSVSSTIFSILVYRSTTSSSHDSTKERFNQQRCSQQARQSIFHGFKQDECAEYLREEQSSTPSPSSLRRRIREEFLFVSSMHQHPASKPVKKERQRQRQKNICF